MTPILYTAPSVNLVTILIVLAIIAAIVIIFRYGPFR